MKGEHLLSHLSRKSKKKKKTSDRSDSSSREESRKDAEGPVCSQLSCSDTCYHVESPQQDAHTAFCHEASLEVLDPNPQSHNLIFSSEWR